jgi:hypothetical protein
MFIETDLELTHHSQIDFEDDYYEVFERMIPKEFNGSIVTKNGMILVDTEDYFSEGVVKFQNHEVPHCITKVRLYSNSVLYFFLAEIL